MSKNIYLNNNISSHYFNKSTFLKDRIKLNKIINKIFVSLDSNRDTFHSLSKKFNFNFKTVQLKKFDTYKSVILIGIGGSILGSQTLYSFFRDKIKKKFTFLDNLDQFEIKKIKKKTDLKKSLFIIISKSGNTLETLVNSNFFKDNINSKNSIIITEKKNNLLNVFAKKKKFYTYITKIILVEDTLFCLRSE